MDLFVHRWKGSIQLGGSSCTMCQVVLDQQLQPDPEDTGSAGEVLEITFPLHRMPLDALDEKMRLQTPCKPLCGMTKHELKNSSPVTASTILVSS